MNIQFDIKQLQSATNFLSKFVKSGTDLFNDKIAIKTVDNLCYFYAVDRDRGQAIYKIQCKSEENGCWVIPTTNFFNTIKTYVSDVSFSKKDNKVVIKHNKSSFKIPILEVPTESWTQFRGTTSTNNTLTIDSKLFKKMLSWVTVAVPSLTDDIFSSASSKLLGVNIKGDGTNILMEGSDGQSYIEVKHKLWNNPFQLFIPRSIITLLKTIQEEFTIVSSGTTLTVKGEDFMLNLKTTLTTYPNTEVFKNTQEISYWYLPSDLLDSSCKRLKILLPDFDRSEVTVSDTFIVSIKNSDIEEEFDLLIPSKEELKFKLNLLQLNSLTSKIKDNVEIGHCNGYGTIRNSQADIDIFFRFGYYLN